ncbi:MAG: hypothetical protein WKF67_04140 [Rubrobacteraceae bacterium]
MVAASEEIKVNIWSLYDLPLIGRVAKIKRFEQFAYADATVEVVVTQHATNKPHSRTVRISLLGPEGSELWKDFTYYRYPTPDTTRADAIVSDAKRRGILREGR